MNLKSILRSVGVAVLVAVHAAEANLQFNLIPDPGMSQQAINGFSAAASLWSAVLGNNITVNLQIGFTTLPNGVIGQTSSQFAEYSYPQVRSALQASRVSADDFSSYAGLQTGSLYYRLINHTSNSPNGPNSALPYVDSMDRVGMTTANAKALGLLGPGGTPDATIRFSSNFAFDFNHGTTIDPNSFDFVGVAAHEIGHVLGFISGVDDIDTYNGSEPGGNFSSNMIDLFRFSLGSRLRGPGYTDYTADVRNKYFSVDGGTNFLFQFSTGRIFGDGQQASHWKDFLGIGIMDPTASLGERLAISAADLRAFDVMGYTLVPVPEPSTCVLLFVVASVWLVARHRGARPSSRQGCPAAR